MARPRKEIDPELVRSLAQIHCTMEEIAAVCKCSVDTLERRFAEIIKEGKHEGKSSLRRMQWREAKNGNVSMLIWLGKQHLGQKEPKHEQDSVGSAVLLDKLLDKIGA